MSSIFISYRRMDSGGHASRIFEQLKSWFPENQIFIDINSIDFGKDFPDEIECALMKANAVIVVIGPDWLKTINERAGKSEIDFVRQEISIALQRTKSNEVEIFPVLVGGAATPTVNDLQDDLKVDIGKLFDYHMCELLADYKQWNLNFNRLRKRLANTKGVPKSFLQKDLHTEQPIQLEPLNADAVRQSFSSVSSTLLNWPQEIDGAWIERPELDQLYAQVNQNQSPVTVLLGEPGGGKSAILARLGARLKEDEIVLLAIKADQLPRSMNYLHDLDQWIGGEIRVTNVLRRLALNCRVVVLIDQLDALSELMDQHTERLGLLLRFVSEIREIPNVSVVVSCREFEFRFDVRFNSLGANEVLLKRPSWESVEPLIASRGLNTSGWSEDVRNVLSTPQHLAMFLQHLADDHDGCPYPTYQSLLARIIEVRLMSVYGERTVEAAEYIATTMASDEELWVGRGKFESKFGTELRNLEESDLLIHSRDNLRISFRHQTVFDYLRARAFLRDEQNLATYIVEQKRQSLFVRPILFSTLRYLRASDIAVYRNQFDNLWSRKNLRLHIRTLLVTFLGHLDDPDTQEVSWLFPSLEDPSFQPIVLLALAGSRGWFDRILSRLPTYMSDEPGKAKQVEGILIKATSFKPRDVLRLVEKYWLIDDAYLDIALSVMKNYSSWDEKSVEIACKLADQVPSDNLKTGVTNASDFTNYSIQACATKISDVRPDLAPRLIFRYLRAKTRTIDQTEPNGDIQPAEQTEYETSINEELKTFENLINRDISWHAGIEEIARRHPRGFVEEMWGWLGGLFYRLEKLEMRKSNRYRDDLRLPYSEKLRKNQPLWSSMEIAIQRFAETESNKFLKFLEENKSSDLIIIHRLLSLGVERIARQNPVAALEYLLEDPRRFAIGNYFNEYSNSQAVIAAVVPWLQKNDALRLEDAIKEWNPYEGIPNNLDARTRQNRMKSIRLHRLKLLRVFPSEQLSPEGWELLKQEDRAFADFPAEPEPVSVKSVDSPMSSEQMEKAKDEDILALFEELTDDTEWDHPTRRWSDSVGGSILASREFGKFAGESQDRALNLIRNFQPGKSERPAGEALYELAKGGVQPEELIACIHELDKRGFASEHFRNNAARSLSAIASRNGGLGNETCIVLEKWIRDWGTSSDEVSDDYKGGNLGETPIQKKAPNIKQRSLLWGKQDQIVLTDGNYFVLNALRMGFLCRNPQAFDQWLEVLERHLHRNENPVVWRTIAPHLAVLANANRLRATRFFESFYTKHPEVFLTDTGVVLVARVMSWIPDQLFDIIINNWISGNWQYGPQAAGELLALKFCYSPDDEIAKKQIESILSEDNYCEPILEALRAGITRTLVATWTEPALRARSTKYLVQLVEIDSGIVDIALIRSLEKVSEFIADSYTSDLFNTLLKRPAIFAEVEYFLIEELKLLLRNGLEPKLVYRVVREIIQQKAGEIGDIGSNFSTLAPDLADLALTLHRIPATSEQGLELFESLMDEQAYGLEERVSELDRLAFR